MEETNGSMGLNESLNSDLTSKENNNIDIERAKRAEARAKARLELK